MGLFNKKENTETKAEVKAEVKSETQVKKLSIEERIESGELIWVEGYKGFAIEDGKITCLFQDFTNKDQPYIEKTILRQAGYHFGITLKEAMKYYPPFGYEKGFYNYFGSKVSCTLPTVYYKIRALVSAETFKKDGNKNIGVAHQFEFLEQISEEELYSALLPSDYLIMFHKEITLEEFKRLRKIDPTLMEKIVETFKSHDRLQEIKGLNLSTLQKKMLGIDNNAYTLFKDFKRKMNILYTELPDAEVFTAIAQIKPIDKATIENAKALLELETID